MPEEEKASISRTLGDLINKQVHEELLEELAAERGARGRRRSHGGRPDGIVAIVFTDVEDSTGLVTRLGDQAARRLIQLHVDTLREAAGRHGGVEVERAGDGFMVAFATASGAVAFATDLQRATRDHPETAPAGVRVRVGMETGEVIPEEQGYFGRTVFAAARISEVARGGQIVVSDATRLIAGPGEHRFRDLGEHDLKGLGGPYRLHEVLWDRN
jgi:class 3 adenylate cyclase